MELVQYGLAETAPFFGADFVRIFRGLRDMMKAVTSARDD